MSGYGSAVAQGRPSSPLTARTEVRDRTAVIHLAGRFDFVSHPQFRAASKSALADGTVDRIVIDLTETGYVDSAALGMMLIVLDQAKTASKRLSLTFKEGPVGDVIRIANFHKVFDVHIR